MSNTPTKDCTFEISSEINGKGEVDILHVIGQDQQIDGWLDVNGVPGGNLSVPGPAGAPGATGPAGSSGAPGTSNVPWFDIQDYGGLPQVTNNIQETTTATTVATSPNVTIGAAKHFTNGEGICIPQAGAATSQSTPNAPTLACPAISGSGPSGTQQTLTYQLVGFDSLGGLTAASASGTLTTAPSVFGAPNVLISSISVSTNVCTVNLSAPLNADVEAGMTLHIVGVTGKTDLNGRWTIASAPTTSQVTFSVTSADGSGTVGAASFGRVSNTAVISAITRSASGVITITTASNHNFVAQAGNTPTVVIIENVTPVDLNGYWMVATASGTTITCNTGILGAETGVVTLGSSTATVWEYVDVTCPTLAGTTIGYYVYADSPAPGGSVTLIGKVLLTQKHFRDWGPYYASGFIAPAYVPTSAPVSAQNQMFTSTIVSGGGTTSLVLANNVPTSIAALGATIMHDSGPNLVAACAARAEGAVFLSPDENGAAFCLYIFNSPITIPTEMTLIFGTGCIINETITYAGIATVNAVLGTTYAVTPQFSQTNYVNVFGLGSPMMKFSESFTMRNIGFSAGSNGQYLVQDQQEGFYTTMSQVSFDCGANGTSVGLVYNGSCTNSVLDTVNFKGGSVLGTHSTSTLGPLVGALWLKASDAAGGGANTSSFFMKGANTFNHRGILVDQQFSNAPGGNMYFGDSLWNQAATMPTITLLGSQFSNIYATNVTNDTSTPAALGCFATSVCTNIAVMNSVNASSWPIVTGVPISGLILSGNTNQYQNTQTTGSLSGTTNVTTLSSTPATLAQTLQGQIERFSDSSPLFWDIPAPTGVAATQSGGGTFAAGAWDFIVTVHGLNGGQGLLSQASSSLTTDGSHAVSVTWNASTATTGFSGYDVWARLNASGSYHKQNSTPVQGTSTSFSANSNLATLGTLPGTGFPLVDPNQIAVPLVRLANGFFKADLATTTLTANRLPVLPDASGNILVEISTGIGNGSSGNIQAPAKSTGTGPTTPGTIVAWAQVNIGGTVYWLPLAQ